MIVKFEKTEVKNAKRAEGGFSQSGTRYGV